MKVSKRRMKVWNWLKRLNPIRAVSLLRYKSDQHDLICNAVKCGKDYEDDGCTAYEAICVLMLKIDTIQNYLERKAAEPGDDIPELHGNASEMLEILNKHHDDFEMIPLYGTEFRMNPDGSDIEFESV